MECGSLGGMPHRRVSDPVRLHSLIDAMLQIGESADHDVVLAKIVERAVDLVGARFGALGVLDEDGSSLRSFHTVGISDADRELIGSPPVGRGLLGVVIAQRRTIRLDDLSTDPSSVGFPPGHPQMHRFLGVPVRVGADEVFGNLYLCDRIDGEPFSEEDEAIVEAFGLAAGLIICEGRLRLRLAEMTLHEERPGWLAICTTP